MSIVTQLFDSPPNTKNVAGTICYELIDVLINAPIMEHKTKYMIPVLEELFKDVNWAKSFESPLIIVYDEVITTEILVGIHSWLRTKCADIENITLVTSNHCGVQRWWRHWCEVNHQRSFTIAEVSLGYSHSMTGWHKMEQHPIRYPLPAVPTADDIANKKHIQYHFNVYGGTYPTLERIYIILRLLEIQSHGVIEYIGSVYNKQDILNYVEDITYFKNQKEVDKISKLYDQYVVNNRLKEQELQFNVDHNPVKNEHFFSGHQYEVDSRCFANVARETLNFHPYTTVTEKTLRSFLHHLAVIPTAYKSIDDLEAQGFWFPHDVIDYSYQSQPDHSRRMNMIVDALKKMIDQFSTDDLNHYYQENLTQFHHNTKLVYDIVQDPLITYRKLNP